MKVDVYKRKEQFLNWKNSILEDGIPGMSRASSDVVVQYILDMEAGQNIAKGTAKGGRSYPRLCNLVQRMTWITRKLEERGVADLRKCDEKSVFSIFSDMERGVLLTRSGTPYKSHGDYAKVFRAFWHWWMKVNRKQGKTVRDITEDISTSASHAPFVYISKARLDQMLPYFSIDEQVLLVFLFDSMVRSPTEVMSLKAGHIYEQEGEMWVTIPEEVSKTFGRTLNLLYSGQAISEYVIRKGLGADDYLFVFDPSSLNKKMQKVVVQLFGDTQSHAKGDRYSRATLYDLRHSGAVHFRLLAKENPSEISLDAVRHRGGWVNLKMLDYYTQFLGLDGRIEKRGMLLSREKHELEKEVDALRTEKNAGDERFAVLEAQLALLRGQLEEVTSFLQKSRVAMEGVSQHLTAPHQGQLCRVQTMKVPQVSFAYREE